MVNRIKRYFEGVSYSNYKIVLFVFSEVVPLL